MVEGRDATAPTKWFAARPQAWLDQVRFATRDMAAAYKLCFDTVLPNAIQILDPFHVVKAAIGKVDQCRRRVQQEQTGHRGHKHDPLYRSRRLLTMGAERLDAEHHHKINDLLDVGDPDGEVRRTWWAVTRLRQLYQHPNRGYAAAMIWLFADAFTEARNPPELRQLGRTLLKSLQPIAAWFLHAQISNARAEAVNNLTKKSNESATASPTSTTTGPGAYSPTATSIGHCSTPSTHTISDEPVIRGSPSVLASIE